MSNAYATDPHGRAIFLDLKEVFAPAEKPIELKPKVFPVVFFALEKSN
jgi:hypothetical protein